jgi:hypothetical protein
MCLCLDAWNSCLKERVLLSKLSLGLCPEPMFYQTWILNSYTYSEKKLELDVAVTTFDTTVFQISVLTAYLFSLSLVAIDFVVAWEIAIYLKSGKFKAVVLNLWNLILCRVPKRKRRTPKVNHSLLSTTEIKRKRRVQQGTSLFMRYSPTSEISESEEVSSTLTFTISLGTCTQKTPQKDKQR